MKKSITILAMSLLFLTGCHNLRFVPNQAQKQNAFLHHRTAMLTAVTAREQNCSERLKDLTDLSEHQSRAFVTYFGLPEELPKEDIAIEDAFSLADRAAVDSAKRPDLFDVTEASLELAIAVSALFGGLYASKIIAFCKDAKQKTKALREIVTANQTLKNTNAEIANAFKIAHKNQSPATKQLVTRLKTER